MTRRERILTALGGGVPDRPPIAFDSHGKTLDPVFAHYGVNDKNGLWEAAGIEGFSVWEWNAIMGRYVPETGVDEGGHPLDFWGNSSQHAHGLAACDTAEDLEAHPWPKVEDFDFSHVPARCDEIVAKDMVVSAGHMGLGYQMHNMLRGNEKALFDVCDEDYMDVFMEKLAAFTLGYLEALLDAGGGKIEVVRADDDVGTMDRLMIGPDMWRAYYKPAWQKAFDLVHAKGARVWLHSCGHIAPLLEDLVEIGVDCWNPFPEYVKGNEHEPLAKWRKGRLALDGGVNHLTIVNGTPDEVREETLRVLDRFAPDGGLLIGPSQVFTEDMPAENIIAFLDTARQYG